MAFHGNPNVAISAIDTSGGIVCSRTSGQTPCFVQVSGSGITATGTSRPYEDLEFSWDFGDPSGAETFTRPTDGATVNANTQTGPEAAYVYRSAGTYTITLTIRGQNGATFTTATVTQTITVSAFSASGGTYYFDSVNGSDGNNGTSSATPKQTISALNTTLATANRRVLLAKGSRWTGATGLTVDASNIRIEAYGTGADPIVEITSGSANGFFVRNGGSASPSSKSDIVVSGVSFLRSGGDGCAVLVDAASNATATIDNVFFDRCPMAFSNDGGNTVCIFRENAGLLTKCGIWACSNTAPDAGTLNEMGLYGGIDSWFFAVGGTFRGNGSDEILDHHIYPNIQAHSLYRWIDFQEGGIRNYCINTNFNRVGASGLEYADYHLVSECDLSGTQRACDAGNGDNDPTMSRFRNFVIERNTMHDLSANGLFLFYCCETMTVRDSTVWDCNGGEWFVPSSGLAAILKARLYRNRIYRASGSGAVVSFSGTWTQAQTITDNRIHDARTSAQIIQATFADHVSAGSLVNRNQYYAPSDTDGAYLLDGATAKTFSEWQAAGFDALGLVRDPEWTAPASGDFSSPRPIRLRLI